MREFLCGTLLYVQQKQLCAEKSLWEVVRQCVDQLKEKNLITVTSDSHGQTLQVTKLGKATYKGKPRHSHFFMGVKSSSWKKYSNLILYCRNSLLQVKVHGIQYNISSLLQLVKAKII